MITDKKRGKIKTSSLNRDIDTIIIVYIEKSKNINKNPDYCQAPVVKAPFSSF
jgi:hypothetical protein